MRWLWRSATTSRPCESNSSACGVRNSPGPVPVLPMTRRNLPFLSNTEMRATRLGSVDVGVALRHVDVAVARIGHDVSRIGQRFGRISPHARLPERQQDLAFRTELHDDASLVAFAGKLLEIVGARGSCVGHPHVSISIDVDAMRPHEHPAAKAPDLLARTHRNGGPGWPCCRDSPGSSLASIGRLPTPTCHRGRWPRRWNRPTACAFDIEPCPVPDDAIGIGAAVDGRNLVRLRGASPLLRLNAGHLQRNADDDRTVERRLARLKRQLDAQPALRRPHFQL